MGVPPHVRARRGDTIEPQVNVRKGVSRQGKKGNSYPLNRFQSVPINGKYALHVWIGGFFGTRKISRMTYSNVCEARETRQLWKTGC
jgi:hypothetical protein